jgi:hypothetical protein
MGKVEARLKDEGSRQSKEKRRGEHSREESEHGGLKTGERKKLKM